MGRELETMSEREAIHMPITIEKARLNVWNIASIFLGIAVTAFGWGVTYNNMQTANEMAEKNNAAAVSAIAAVRMEVQEIQTQLPPVQSSIQRLTEIAAENRAAIKASNERIDRIVESFGGKLDGIVANVSKIATQVEVLAARFGERPNAPQRTRFTLGTLEHMDVPKELQN